MGAGAPVVAAQLEGERGGGEAGAFEPLGDAAAEPLQLRLDLGELAQVALEGALGADRHRALPAASHRPRVRARGIALEPLSPAAETMHQLVLVGGAEIGDGVEPQGFEPRRRDRPDAGQHAHLDRRQHGLGIAVADDAKPARLAEIARHLGQHLVGREPDRHGDADPPLHQEREPRQRPRRRLGRAGIVQIEIGLVDRHRLDPRRRRFHQLADAARCLAVLLHVRADHGGVGTEPHRLRHRQGRAHAEPARDIARGQNHAAQAAADDHRPVGQFRPVALLDAGIERVAIDMRDGEKRELGMIDDAGRAAPGAARLRLRLRLRLVEPAAIAAEAGRRRRHHPAPSFARRRFNRGVASSARRSAARSRASMMRGERWNRP